MSRKKRNRPNRPQRSIPPPATGARQRSAILRLLAGYGTWLAAGVALVLGGLRLYGTFDARQAAPPAPAACLVTPGPSTLTEAPAPAAVHPPAVHYVGSQVCATCHAQAYEAWRSSDHALAMQEANAHTVLGDFHDAQFTAAGITSTFFTRDDKFYVNTDGPDGALHDYEIRYTFGVRPLQQYLIEFPDGRLQALSIAWDTRPKEQGGQRWFHLYPDEGIKHDDVLHWTKLNQNWNFMCAECHSTGVRKNYDAAADRFATTWAEISVGCEACHGQG